MGQAMTSRFTGLSAGNARVAVLGAVSLVVVCVALGLVLTGVATGEVAATLLFLPVFAAGYLGGRTAGYLGAVVATVVYVALRRSDLADAGIASAGVLSLTRAGAYLVVGHVGALAQALLPSGDPAGPARAGRPTRPAAAAVDRRRATVRQDGLARTQGRAERAWNEPWENEPDRMPRYDTRQPVLAGVGSPATGAPQGDPRYGAQPPTTMSGAWPPEPPSDPWRDEPAPRQGRRDDAPGPGGWDDAGGTGWQDGGGPDGGWQGGAPGGGGWQDDGWQDGPGGQAPLASSWQQPGDDTRPLEDDSWAAVQQSWRQQHGVPLEDDHGTAPDQRGGPDEWGYEPSAPADDRWSAPAAPDPWGDPHAPGRSPAPPAHDPSGWGGAPPADTGWGPAPAAPAGAAPDPWAGAAPVGQGGGADEAFWGGTPAGADDQVDPWTDAAPTGGTWSPAGPAPADQWSSEQPGRNGGAWSPEHGASHGGAWSPEQAAPNGAGWSPQAGGQDWPPSPHEAEPQGWGALSGDAWPTTGQTEAVWDDREAPDRTEAQTHGDVWSREPESQPEPAPGPGPAWPAAGAFDTGGRGYTGGSPAVGASEQYADLPAVDHETGLWTAKFLRDRLASERARSRRTGHPFSLVLVQVPDGPLAQLPYRRQLTLLRELGYQFVAGGVVDHLVHVPDQAQHWFAVILPDTDRSGAQVLERRLRLGIGGYLSSRGLRLRELESASLTAPDDDPAMGAIWEGLIGPDEAGQASGPRDY
jgi:hypothetical protein